MVANLKQGSYSATSVLHTAVNPAQKVSVRLPARHPVPSKPVTRLHIHLVGDLVCNANACLLLGLGLASRCQDGIVQKPNQIRRLMPRY